MGHVLRGFGTPHWPVFLLLFTLFAEPTSAQVPSHFRVGIGGAMGGDVLGAWGGQGFVEFSANPDATLDLRGRASYALGAFWGLPTQSVFGLDLAAVVAFGTSIRPYLGLGAAYTYTDASPNKPLSYDLGVAWVAGVEWRRSSGTWFIEARPRVFGNVFYEHASTRSLFLLSVGRTWR